MKLEDRLREMMRFRHYSLRTEEAYVGWYRRFVYFHGRRHPNEMGTVEVEEFLTELAVRKKVVAATQNQALNALVFLFKEVLQKPFDGVDAMRAQESKRLPVVLSVEELRKLLMVMTGEEALMGKLLYGCGLRVLECMRLRVKDVDLSGGKVEIRGGKGDKDRVLTMPKSLVCPATIDVKPRSLTPFLTHHDVIPTPRWGLGGRRMRASFVLLWVILTIPWGHGEHDMTPWRAWNETRCRTA